MWKPADKKGYCTVQYDLLRLHLEYRQQVRKPTGFGQERNGGGGGDDDDDDDDDDDLVVVVVGFLPSS